MLAAGGAWHPRRPGHVHPGMCAARAAGARRAAPRRRRPASGASCARHPVDADHPGHHVLLDVAVVEPRAGVLLAPADAGRSRPGPTVCVSRGVPSGAIQRWPWTWKVWCSEPIAITSHCTRSPTFEREDRRVADERAAVDRLEVAHRRRRRPRTRGRARASWRAEDREHPVHAAGDRVVHRRRVVVVGPDADASRGRRSAGRSTSGRA